jgi:hypothetical protein
MRAATGRGESVDLTAAYALRDAIVEFDPEIHRIAHRHVPLAQPSHDWKKWRKIP